MRIEEIDDRADPRLDDFRDLTDVALRRVLEPAGGLYLAESEKVLRRALGAGHRPRAVLAQRRWLPQIERIEDDFPQIAGTPVYVVADDVAESVTGYTVHRGLLASMHRPEPSPWERLVEADAGAPGRRRRIAVFENFVDHTNVGAAFRSAAALGVDGVLVTPECADPLYRRSIRVSMGTVFQVAWTRVAPWPDAIAGLQERDYTVAGMTLGEGAITMDDLVAERHDRLALVFGNEGHGLTAGTDRALDRRVTIPMGGGVDSLNVAAAAAVAFYATR